VTLKTFPQPMFFSGKSAQQIRKTTAIIVCYCSPKPCDYVSIMNKNRNFAATAAYFELRVRKASGVARKEKFRSAAELYREKASQFGIDMAQPLDTSPDQVPSTSRRDRVAAMFRVYGVTGVNTQK
jgi:hypothetical protein